MMHAIRGERPLEGFALVDALQAAIEGVGRGGPRDVRGRRGGDIGPNRLPAFERLNAMMASLPLADVRTIVGDDVVDALVATTEALALAVAGRTASAGIPRTLN